MDDILDAMTSSEDDPVTFFLDLETGKVESRFRPDVFEELGEDEGDFERQLEEDPDRFVKRASRSGLTSRDVASPLDLQQHGDQARASIARAPSSAAHRTAFRWPAASARCWRPSWGDEAGAEA